MEASKNSTLAANLLAMEPPRKNHVYKYTHFFRYPLLHAFFPKRVLRGFHVWLIFISILYPHTTTAAYDDAKVKAAFIYRLLYFIEQPVANTPSDAGSFNICVLGDNPFTHVREELERRSVENRSIALIQKQRNEPVSDCHILYISRSETTYFLKTIQSLSTDPILTISDISQFAKYGGMVGFTEYNNTLRLEINAKALAAAKFQIDPHLLEVALHVYR